MNKIKSIADLIKILSKRMDKSNLWFRGQGKSSWELVPNFLRKKRKESEMTLLQKFKQNAALLLQVKPSNSFDWLFLMQHYGMPTRLLDWSESPLAALYFAVYETKNDKHDGAFWVLDPCALNKIVGIDTEEQSYIPSFDDPELENYSVEKNHQEKTSKLKPIATIATRNNPRIQAQLGVFTISHRDDTPIEELGDGKQVSKYEIPKTSKQVLRDQLTLLKISHFQMFPELSSICRDMKGL